MPGICVRLYFTSKSSAEWQVEPEKAMLTSRSAHIQTWKHLQFTALEYTVDKRPLVKQFSRWLTINLHLYSKRNSLVLASDLWAFAADVWCDHILSILRFWTCGRHVILGFTKLWCVFYFILYYFLCWHFIDQTITKIIFWFFWGFFLSVDKSLRP